MLSSSLHALWGHGPEPSVQVDLIPRCPKHFSGPRSCQYCEFESPRGSPVLLTQFRDEFTDGVVREGGVVFHAAHLGACRQEHVEMSAPSRGIVAVAVATNLGPVQYHFDASAQAAGRLGLTGPNRLQDPHD